MALSIDALVRCGVPAEKARAHLPHLASAMREHGITTRVRARMFLAQVMHESAALRYFEEIASGAAYEGRRDLGNVRPGDGRRFKGRGPIQLTGRHNYTLYGKLLGIDLVGRPQVAATPRVGWRVSALYFQRAGCNDAADRNDFRDVTRRINGGYNGYADRVRYYRLLGGADVVPGVPYLGVGDSGDGVVTLTRRLSYVRAPSGEPYLDGKRRRFDKEAEDALRAFQRDHGLQVDGRYGPNTTRRLARATAKQKQRRAERPPRTSPAPQSKPAQARPGRPTRRTRTSAEILAGLDRLDVRGDRLRAALLERGRELEKALERREAARVGNDDLRSLAKQLDRLDATIHEVQEALAHPVAVQRSKPAASGKPGNGAATPAATAVAVEPAPATGAPGIDELAERLVALDAEGDRVRALLADRFRELEARVARERPAPRRRRVAPPRRKRVRTRPTPTEDGPGGEAASVPAEARSFRVRQSKIALARFLRRHRAQTSGALRRTLLREARSPKRAREATPAWERAVREAQAIARLPVTGELDGNLLKALRRDWPSESVVRRAARATPAWRLIPGQLSPNFNLRELDCSDGTPYVSGLMREQGLTKAQARRRAKELAERLERVRKRGGNRALRVTSAFRTRAYNARLSGAATNSAHTRGFAADMPAPAGVALATHHRHVRSVFDSGVGLYGTFVHGDFDPTLGRRDWRG